MSDNTQLNPGTGGDSIRDLDRGNGLKTQVVVLDAGGISGAGNESLVNQNNPLPVSDMQGSEAQGPDQPFFVSIVGDPNGDYPFTNLLEQLIDPNSALQLHVNVANQPKTDPNAANAGMVPTDCAGFWLPSGGTLILDTAGYNSISVHSVLGVVTPYFSNTNIPSSFNNMTVWGSSSASNILSQIIR